MKISKHNESLLTAEYLRSQLSYNSDTGEFRWIAPAQGRELNKPAGGTHSNGYRRIKVAVGGRYCEFLAHRLAWLYVYGVWPTLCIDHIDLNKTNNRIANLREANFSENSRNRKKSPNRSSRYLGVSWWESQKKWVAQIKFIGKRIYIGSYDSEIDAALAYNKTALSLDHKFLRTNEVAA
jgi:hypothetical protein